MVSIEEMMNLWLSSKYIIYREGGNLSSNKWLEEAVSALLSFENEFDLRHKTPFAQSSVPWLWGHWTVAMKHWSCD